MPQIQTQPYNFSRPITTSDTVNFDGTTYSAAPVGNYKPIPCEAIGVTVAGTVTWVSESGVATLTGAAAGEVLPYKAIRVNSTGTTATGLSALYTV